VDLYTFFYRLVPDGDVELAGSMMAFFMALGLGLGAALSILIVKTFSWVHRVCQSSETTM